MLSLQMLLGKFSRVIPKAKTTEPSIFNLIKHEIALNVGCYYNGSLIETNYEDLKINIYSKDWNKFNTKTISYDNYSDKSSLCHIIKDISRYFYWFNMFSISQQLFLHKYCLIKVKCSSKAEAKYLSSLYLYFDVNIIFTW